MVSRCRPPHPSPSPSPPLTTSPCRKPAVSTKPQRNDGNTHHQSASRHHHDLDARAAPRAPLFRHDVGSSRPVVRCPAPIPGGHQRCPRRRRRRRQQRRRWGLQPPQSSHVSLIRSPRMRPRKSDASSARGETGVPRRQTTGRGRGVPPLIWRSHDANAKVRGGAKHGRKRS